MISRTPPRAERVAIILAAGEGKRMKSPLPKVLHPVGGRPMVLSVVETARGAGFARCIVVVGHGREEVERAVPTLSKPRLALHRTLTAQTAFMIARSLVNPRVYAAVGLDPREARRQALENPHYRATMAWMGERVLGFLDEQGLLSPAQKPVWKRSLLMPA